jgi:hypothetical protein
MTHEMTPHRTSTSPPTASSFVPLATSAPQLTDVQLVRLRWCANGNTLRFESASIVDALVEAGYAKQGIGRVVTVTGKGSQYLRSDSVRRRLSQLGVLL